MHDPIRPAEISSFQPWDLTNSPNFDIGVARSGVKGPLIVGSSSERFYEYIEDGNPCQNSVTYYFNDVVVLSILVRT